MLVSRDVYLEEFNKRKADRDLEMDVVSAISVLCDIPPSKVMNTYANLVLTDTVSISDFIQSATDKYTKQMMDDNGYKLVPIPGDITVKKFSKIYDAGKYMLIGSNYCLALVNGNVIIPSHRGSKFFYWLKVRNQLVRNVYMR